MTLLVEEGAGAPRGVGKSSGNVTTAPLIYNNQEFLSS
jgi:hypothetical protein